MNEEFIVDGISYELRDPQLESDGTIISSEIHAHADEWNPYAESSERMMNRICHHLGQKLSPNYSPIFEHWGEDENNGKFVKELDFFVNKQNRE